MSGRDAGRERRREMSLAELCRAVEETKGRAAGLQHLQDITGSPRPRGLLPKDPAARKLRALWISAFHLGVSRDRSDEALAAWLRRRAGPGAAWETPPAPPGATPAARPSPAFSPWSWSARRFRADRVGKARSAMWGIGQAP